MRLSDGHCQSMKLIEEMHVVGRRISDESIAGELNEGLISCVVATGFGPEKLVAFSYAAEILVRNRNRMVKRVKQDGVGCLRTRHPVEPAADGAEAA